MSKQQELLEARRRELAVGRGGRLWHRPVPLEPPFSPFDPFKLSNGKQKAPKGWALVPEPQAWRFLRVRPSDADQYPAALAEQLLVSLNPSYPVAFELVGVGGAACLQLTVADQDAVALQGQVQAHYPECEVFSASDGIGEIFEGLRYARGYRLQRSHLLSLKEGHRAEPYAALVGFLSTLASDEAALFQVLFHLARQPWAGNILKAARSPYDAGKSAFTNLPQLPKRAEAKTGKPLFAAALRLAASHEELLHRLEGAFLTQFQSEENALVPLEAPYPLHSILSRNTHATGMLLNAGELAALVHLPDPDAVPETLPAAEPGAPAPSRAQEDILTPLGVNRYQGTESLVGISEEWLTRHVALFGGTGYGKTNLMQFAFAPLLEQGYGLAVLDPKGDLARSFLDLVPESRLDDVVWFDPTDRDFPPALNVLQASDQLEHEALTAELMVGLKRLFQGNSEFGPRMEWLLRNAIRTLLASEGDKTLYHIPKFLEDSAFRDAVLSTVGDRELREFWQRRNLSASVIDPVLNRLSSFLDRTTIRNIVAQPNRIDFHRIMREQKIFLANLEKGVLQDAAYVLGSFILSRLQLAALGRKPGERQLFPILVDEFHNFAGTGMDTESIETFLSEARSYRAPLVMATQYVGRLNRDVTTALFANAGTMVALHLGQIDAQPLSRELGDFSADDLLDLRVGEAVVRMGSARDAFNVRVPLVRSWESCREEIIARSRERYCRPKAEVEASLRQTLPVGPESTPVQPSSDKTNEPAASEARLTPDQWRMVEYLAGHPDETVTAVYQGLGFGGRKGTNVRKQLRDLGMITEVATHLGQGNRPAVFLVPTLLGLQTLKRPVPKGRGGPIHRYFQSRVAENARVLGYMEVEIEHPLEQGGSVDVHLAQDDRRTAVEIAIHSKPQWECHNIRKCLQAGYDRVIALYLDPVLLERTREFFTRDAIEGEIEGVTFLEVGKFEAEL